MSKAEERALEKYPLMKDDDKEGLEALKYIGIECECASAFNEVQEAKQEYFIEGYHQAEEDLLDNIWHSPDEEPEIDRKIIWESENFLGKHLDEEWKPRIDCFGRKERWCYLADILPSKNWTGERPYSKVDYNKGYDDGYEQAEKDLELTWEDMALINNIVTEMLKECGDNILYDTEKEFCKEVLKKFKAQKGE